MSGRLVGEVIDWLQTPPAADLTMAEATVLMVIAERAHEKTREMWRHRIDDRTLYERIKAVTKQGDAGLSKTLQRLAARGLECRVPIAVGKDGRPVYAAKGRAMKFRLPELPAAMSLPEDGPVDDDASPVDNPPKEAVDNPPADGQRADTRPGFASKGGPTSGLSGPKGGRTSAPNPSSTYPSTTDPSSRVPSQGAKGDARTGARDEQNDQEVQSSDYAEASRILSTLPDLGSALIERARARDPGIDDYRQLVVAAAAIYREGTPA
ncbi:hypothetical protein [Actinomadura sediminis]|uniref:Helix-turn-helix domain-containing protein n=1 Tax=Actinomadura sediminis TaxID=1038904 RepID=A0ABW3ERG3_9ACTN